MIFPGILKILFSSILSNAFQTMTQAFATIKTAYQRLAPLMKYTTTPSGSAVATATRIVAWYSFCWQFKALFRHFLLKVCLLRQWLKFVHTRIQPTGRSLKVNQDTLRIKAHLYQLIGLVAYDIP